MTTRPDRPDHPDHADPSAPAAPSPYALAVAVDAVRTTHWIYAHAQLGCALAPHRREPWVEEHAAGKATDEAISALDDLMTRLAHVAGHAPDERTRNEARVRMCLVLASFD